MHIHTVNAVISLFHIFTLLLLFFFFLLQTLSTILSPEFLQKPESFRRIMDTLSTQQAHNAEPLIQRLESMLNRHCFNVVCLLGREAYRLKLFLFPYKKGCTPKGHNLLSYFLLKQTPFQKGLGVQECKQDVSKVISLVKNGGKSTKCIQSP